ncbi:hypothetical protein SORBI_3005G214300 [Sorghum bicolor]|uniref:Uncharacterized protein n=1 Tax=Sorghum bicolor TaxID=4558 RepID=A0A1B6PTX2_SORBI|nr:hypothetical protein SORBI_3005G214300 [Sorghum bicolor]
MRPCANAICSTLINGMLVASVDVAPVHQHAEPRRGGAGSGVAVEQSQTTSSAAARRCQPRRPCRCALSLDLQR